MDLYFFTGSATLHPQVYPELKHEETYPASIGDGLGLPNLRTNHHDPRIALANSQDL